jgi:glycosyltransferase involved in cell wall biosynthesis
MIIEGQNGYVLEPGDHEGLAERTIRILNDDKLREEFSRNSLRMARSHDIDKSADKLERLYSKLVSQITTRL